MGQYVGARYAVAFSNDAAALHNSCFTVGISEGDEAITTPMTFERVRIMCFIKMELLFLLILMRKRIRINLRKTK